MTQLHPRPTTDPMLESLLRTARDRSARGNATRRDWQRVATIDRDVAHQELREFLVRHGNTSPSTANPYERGTGVSGAVIGFVLGVALVAVTWLVLPWIRDSYISTPIWQHVITSGQFISTVFIPVGIYLGARWSQKRAGDETRQPAGVPKDATLDELLDAFERTQHVGRARVY